MTGGVGPRSAAASTRTISSATTRRTPTGPGLPHRRRRPRRRRDAVLLHPRPRDRLDAAGRGADRRAGSNSAGRHRRSSRRQAGDEHIYWDQASVLVQIGLLDPAGLPVAGVETARKVVDNSRPSNELMSRWAASADEPVTARSSSRTPLPPLDFAPPMRPNARRVRRGARTEGNRRDEVEAFAKDGAGACARRKPRERRLHAAPTRACPDGRSVGSCPGAWHSQRALHAWRHRPAPAGVHRFHPAGDRSPPQRRRGGSSAARRGAGHFGRGR